MTNKLKDVSHVNQSCPSYLDNLFSVMHAAGSTHGNLAGRVKSVSFAGQSRQMTYDKLGNAASETYSKTFGKQDTYTTQYKWDNLGRMLSMIYPDNTMLAYGYDSGGLVNSVADVTGGDPVYYVNLLIYDKFGQRFDIQYGNGIGSRYTYDPDSRRVAEIYTSKRGANSTLLYPVQDLQYLYDPVGDVKGLTNNMYVSFDGKQETVNRSFSYDGFYRLTSSTGHLHDNTLAVGQGTPPVQTDEIRNYSVTTAFNDIHNLTGKTQTIKNVDPYTGNQTVESQYDFTGPTNGYKYTSGKPHFVSSVGGITRYNDADGNNTGYSIGPYQGIGIDWDEEDRMTSWGYYTPGGSRSESYVYNEAGERTVKMYFQSYWGEYEMMYPNQFYTTSYYTLLGYNNNFYGPTTKNIYVGNQRVASVINENTNTFYYHSDHLGSTTYLSDATGAIREHMEYTPWGENWVQQNDVNLPQNYLFTGKEQDATSGLYYFGARYYDPQTSVWMSADPALGKYLESDRKGGGKGVFNSKNLGLYTYCYQNPLVLVDPDGRAPNQAGATNPNTILTELKFYEALGMSNSEALDTMSYNHGGNENRYFYTGKYGWIDTRHFGMAGKLGISKGNIITEILGVLNEISQWIDENFNKKDYRSGFSPEDIPSNAAGARSGSKLNKNEGISSQFEKWLHDSGAKNTSDPSTGYDKLPKEDPSFNQGKDRGKSNMGSKGPDAE